MFLNIHLILPSLTTWEMVYLSNRPTFCLPTFFLFKYTLKHDNESNVHSIFYTTRHISTIIFN